jgi:carbamoyltransferase
MPYKMKQTTPIPLKDSESPLTVRRTSQIDFAVFFGHHDSSVAFADENEILLVLEAERIFRRKHCLATADEMKQLVEIGLKYLHIGSESLGTMYLAILNNQFPPGEIEITGSLFRPIMTRHHENHIGCGISNVDDDTLIVCADGGSEDGTTRLYRYKGEQLLHLADLGGTAASGKFYGTLTQLVVDPSFIAAHAFYPGKTMGLAGVGTVDMDIYATLKEHAPEMCRDHHDPSHFLGYFGLSSSYSEFWRDEKRRALAATGQRFWEDTMIEAILSRRGTSTSLLLVGGCALNVMLNTRLAECGQFERIFVSPVSGDCGQAVGSLLFANRKRYCAWPYLGRGFGATNELPDRLVTDIVDGKIIGWFNGRSEVGPRSLGNRSILGLPSTYKQRDRMNTIKSREPYRPVSPIVTVEKANSYFHIRYPSPYMTFAVQARDNTRLSAPAIVHDDGTSRIQTVTVEENRMMHALLEAIEVAAGLPILMNSSFNVAGDPIVDTPDDALEAFRKSQLDACYINGERHVR